jgi:hypothetical protein
LIFKSQGNKFLQTRILFPVELLLSIIITGEGTMDKKQIDFEDLQKELTGWNEKFGELESLLIDAKPSQKSGYSEPIEILHPEVKLVEMRMAELKGNEEGARDELRHGLQKAIKVLKEAYVKALHYSNQESDESLA